MGYWALGTLVAAFVLLLGMAAAYSPDKLPVQSMHSPTMVIPGVGSGFYIGDGKVVTARHVTRALARRAALEGDAPIEIMDEDGNKYEAVVLWENDEYDIAVLQLKGPTPTAEHAARLTCRMPIVGEPVTLEGNPLDFHFVQTRGSVASAVHIGGTFPMWHEWFFADLTSLPGNSGGPVYEQHGKVIGILVGGLVKTGVPIHMSIVVPAGVLCRLMGRV